MNKRKFWLFRRLDVQLLAALGLCFLIAYGPVALIHQGLVYYRDIWVWEQENMEKEENWAASRIQEFVDRNQLTLKELDQLDRWVHQEHYLQVVLLDKQQVYLVSAMDLPVEEYDQVRSLIDEYQEYYTKELDAGRAKTLTFADGTEISMIIHSFYYEKLVQILSQLNLVLFFIIFLLSFLFFIRKKVRYIRRLSDELKILEGGDLDYAMSVQGEDEIAELARGINQMRLSILDRRHLEEENQRANQDLVMRLSHDLRTPLTALIGYLEIVLLNEEDPKQKRNYIEAARAKAFQIKEQSEKLFEYFLISQKTEDSYYLQSVPVTQLLERIRQNSIRDLESHGFKVVFQPSGNVFSGSVAVDMESFSRVMDNLVSNLFKYADPAFLIRFETIQKKDQMIFQIINRIRLTGARSSTGIGINTCERIMKAHQGRYLWKRTDDCFISTVELPLKAYIEA